MKLLDIFTVLLDLIFPFKVQIKSLTASQFKYNQQKTILHNYFAQLTVYDKRGEKLNDVLNGLELN